jgi:hypothetical protein
MRAASAVRRPNPTARTAVVPAQGQRASFRRAWLLLVVIATLVVPTATASSAAAAEQPRLSVDNATARTLHLLFAESGTVHCRLDHAQRACDDPQDLAALVSPWEVLPGQSIEVRDLFGNQPSPRDGVVNVRYAIGLGGDQAQLAIRASGHAVTCRVLATTAYTCRQVGGDSGTVRFSLEPVG